ncbi:MAG: two-component regulator propeller domain-containing protein [Flavipsychrobacter sp.]
MKTYKLYLIAVMLLLANAAVAQDRPIGYWRAHMPYKKAISVATDGSTLYVATEQAFYSYNMAKDEITSYSKVDGMSDVGMSDIGYDALTETVILGYQNSNIDLYSNNSFYNIPYLKLENVTGSKSINAIYTDKGLAYISTDIGILVINLEKKEVKETYNFTINNQTIAVKGFTMVGNFFYAATSQGLYKANKNNPNLQAFSSWQAIDNSRNFIDVASVGNKVFATLIDSLFSIENDVLNYRYRSDSATRALNEGLNGVWILENYGATFNGTAKKINMDYFLVDSFKLPGFAKSLVDLPTTDSAKYIADEFTGLKKRTLKGDPFNTIGPEGPKDFATFDIIANNKEVWVAHGGYDDVYKQNGNSSGFSKFSNQKWTLYNGTNYPKFGDSLKDITHITKGPDGSIYAGSTTEGLFILKPDGSVEVVKQGVIPTSVTGPLYRVSGLVFDDNGTLWLTVFGGDPYELLARTKDGVWYKYTALASRPIKNSAAHVIIDDNNQKWYAAPSGGGAMVYDDGGTVDNLADDSYRQLRAGDGSGGLPNNEVYCLAKDKDGAIWIGTADGVGIVNCPRDVITGGCEAEKRVVQFDDFAGFLFQNEQVRTIAVDGANRKWIGTNNGLWLIAPDGDKIVERFTVDNSPLPSNRVQKITIDPITGDVYIGTEKGLMSYRGTATDGGRENADELITYPNPIPSGYTGTIAIKGFVENADVRITDVSGQLIYRTKALGGQAIWNGRDYTGKRPQSGVYLIFGTSKDGAQTKTGKLLFME